MPEADLGALFSSFTRTAWRLETLEQYTVPDEEQSFADFLAGRPVAPRTPENNGWISLLAAAHGRSFGRVHAIRRPLSPYVQFEMGGYRENVAHGEDVRIADRSQHDDQLADLDRDFWIFDDTTVAVMNYDDEGRFHGASLADDPAPYLRLRERALAVAVPLAEFMDRMTVGS